MTRFSLTGNQLKLIALVTMTIDHAGILLFPGVPALRIIGRLAFPIYAFLIAEGCRHTRSMSRYFGTMAIFAAGCQLFYLIFDGSLYQSVLVTFTMSIGLVWLLREDRLPSPVHNILVVSGFAAVLFLCEGLPLLLRGTDYAVDYGAVGALLPVLVWLGKDRREQLALFALGTVVLALTYGGIQWWGLGAIPLVMLYGGRRGTVKLKYLFYVYYPLHLAVLYLIAMVF